MAAVWFLAAVIVRVSPTHYTTAKEIAQGVVDFGGLAGIASPGLRVGVDKAASIWQRIFAKKAT